MRAVAIGMVFTALLPFSACQDEGEPVSVGLLTRPVAEDRTFIELRSHLNSQPLALGEHIFVRIFKREATLELWSRAGEGPFRLTRVYPICSFSGGLGPKLREGDWQSPEGFYSVGPSQMNPNSHFHLSFDLGFPNAYDRAHGRTGSAIMVHGGCASIGCYAMTDEIIEEIYAAAEAAFENGQKFFRVHAFPFRMTDDNMRWYGSSDWGSFWHNLKVGYDFFEKEGFPPEVEVAGNRYVIDYQRDDAA